MNPSIPVVDVDATLQRWNLHGGHELASRQQLHGVAAGVHAEQRHWPRWPMCAGHQFVPPELQRDLRLRPGTRVGPVLVPPALKLALTLRSMGMF